MKNKHIILSIVSCVLTSTLGYSEETAATATAVSTAADGIISKEEQDAITPAKALELLKAGNERYVTGKSEKQDYLQEQKATAAGQYPIAAIVSCIDSRTSSEIVFDAGHGDLFNARIAGNIVNADILGSLEFATKAAGAKVVLVLGHGACGAVKGACDHVKLSDNLTGLLEKIEPAMEAVKTPDGQERNSKNTEFVDAVTEENVKLTMKKIVADSAIIKELVDQGKVIIAGGVQDLHTGKVTFVENK